MPATTQNIYGMTDTWSDESATYTAIKMSVTDTASDSGSLLLDLQVDGISIFKAGKEGSLYLSSSDASDYGKLYVSGGGSMKLSHKGSDLFNMFWEGTVGQVAVFQGVGTNRLHILSDAALVLDSRSGVIEFESHVSSGNTISIIPYHSGSAVGKTIVFNNNGQTPTTADVAYFSTYNTTDSALSVYYQTTRKASFGYTGALSFTQGTLTTSIPQINGAATWNSGGTTFTAWKLDITNTSSDAASMLVDLQVGSSSVWSVRRSGATLIGSANAPTSRLLGLGDTTADAIYGIQMANSQGSWYLDARDSGNSGDFWVSTGGAALLTVHRAGGISSSRLITPRTSELTIASGVITVTGSYHDVDTQSDDATDDLDTINGGTDGAILVLRANNSGRTVVVKDGTGNIQCGGDRSLDNTQDTITLIYDGTLTAWLEIAFASNGA